jgi:hypothetical protein
MRYISPIPWPQCQFGEHFGEPPSIHHTNTWSYKLLGRQLSVTCEACGWQTLSNLHEVAPVDIKDRDFYDRKAREIGVTDWSQMIVVLDEDSEGMVKVLELRGIRM